MQIYELEELRNEVYGNTKIAKERVKIFCMINISYGKYLSLVLYNSTLYFFSGKIKSRWTGPFVVKSVFPHDAVEIIDTKNENNFKVNGQHLKPFLESVTVSEMAMGLFDPVYW